jgi:energy-coupling factor transporter ATP-binding protein EcfA2
MSESNPWAAQYELMNDRETIMERVTLKPLPFSESFIATKQFSADLLSKRFSDCYLPTERDLDFIQLMLSKAKAHAISYFPDQRVFRKTLHSQDIEMPPAKPVMLCGQAGVGKSSLASALQRLMAFEQRSLQVQGFSGDWKLTPFSLVQMSGIHSLGDVYRLLIASDDIISSKTYCVGRRAQGYAIRKLYREGSCLLGLDEFQFVSQGLTANALITKILLGVAYLGVPFFYICNYSLVKRLLARNSEDIQRLLSEIVVLEPAPPESSDWKMLLAEYQRIGVNLFEFQLADEGKKLWTMSAGIKRHLVVLICAAYRFASASGRRTVRFQDISTAYESMAFSAQRRDIELLISQAIQGKSLRADLWCPLSGRSEQSSSYLAALKQERKAKLADASATAALTAQESGALLRIRGAKADDVLSSLKPQTKPKNPVGKASADDLIATANLFRTTHRKE